MRGESFRGLKRLPSIGDLLAVGEMPNRTTFASSSNAISPPASSSIRILMDLEDVDVVTPTNLLRMRSKMATTTLTQEQLQEMFCGGGGGGSKAFNAPAAVFAEKNESPTNDQLHSTGSSYHSDQHQSTHSPRAVNVFSHIDRPVSREYSRLPDIGSSSTPPRVIKGIDHDSRNSPYNSHIQLTCTHLTIPGSGFNSRPHSATGSLRFSGEKVNLSPAHKLPPVIFNNGCSSRQRTPDSQIRSSHKVHNDDSVNQRSPAVVALMQDDSDDDHSITLSRRSFSVNDAANKSSSKSTTEDGNNVSSVRRRLLSAQQQDHQQQQRLQHIVEPVGGVHNK